MADAKEGGLETTRVILLSLFGKMGKTCGLCSRYVTPLVEKLRRAPSWSERLASPDLWVLVVLALAVSAILFYGVRFKRLSLGVMLAAGLYRLLHPFREDINRGVAGLVGIFSEAPGSRLVRMVVEDAELSVLAVALLAALVVVAVYGILVYLPLAVLAFEMRGCLAGIFAAAPKTSLLLTVLTLLLLFVLLRKVLLFIENVLLAVVFSANGSLGLLTLTCIGLGRPRGFLEFGEGLDLRDPKTLVPGPNLFLWLALAALGLLSQMRLVLSSK